MGNLGASMTDPFLKYRNFLQTGLFSDGDNDPHRYLNMAVSFLVDQFFSDDRSMLANWHGQFWQYYKGSRLWKQITEEELLNIWTRWAFSLPRTTNLDLNSTTARHVLHALKGICEVQMGEMPCWRPNVVKHLYTIGTFAEDYELPSPDHCIAFRDKLLDVKCLVESIDPNTGYDLSSCTYARHAEWFDSFSLAYDLNETLLSKPSCPRWLSFLNASLEGDKARIESLQRFFGYCLLPTSRLQKFLFLFGQAGSGKSTIVSILSSLLPETSVASTSLSELCKEFGMMHLPHKRLLLIPDASSKTLTNAATEERLKSITGCDGVYINRKHLTPLANFHLKYKTVLVSNQLPAFENASSALSRRMVMIPFNKSFVGKEDAHLLENLLEELPGIAHWAVQGAINLLFDELHGNQLFPSSETTKTATRLFNLTTNPIHSFLSEFIEITNNPLDFLSNDLIYIHYSQWSNHEGLTLPSKKHFLTELNQQNIGVIARGNSAGRPYGRSGIKIKPQFLAKLKEAQDAVKQ